MIVRSIDGTKECAGSFGFPDACFVGFRQATHAELHSIVSTPPPSYLKILRPEHSAGDVLTSMRNTVDEAIVVEDSQDSQQIVEGFWRAYSDATGLRIDPGTPADASDDLRAPFAVTPVHAQGLAKAATELADRLQRQQELLKSQQVELAARASVIANQSARVNCADTIARVLSDATMATGTQAAAIYMLDDETETLTTRFVFGLSPVQRLGSTRPLRGARGDLEAMIQGVAAVDDLQAGSMDLYRSPEPMMSGICVCLGDVELPIGTMWLFGEKVTEFGDHHTAAARLAAAGVVQAIAAAGNSSPMSLSVAKVADAELEMIDEVHDAVVESHGLDLPDANAKHVQEYDNVRIGEYSGNASPSPSATQAPLIAKWTRQISNWQHDTLPLGERLAPQWSIDGMIESPLAVAQSWHHWDVLPDGVLSMSMCQHDGLGRGDLNLTSTLDATIARAALQAHASYRHTPGDAVMRVLDTLLQVRDAAIDENGEPLLSLFYAHIDPDTGHTQIASVGDWSTLVVSKYGFRPVGMGKSGIVRDDEFMGRQTAEVRDTVLQPGEVLLVTGCDWMGVKSDDSMAADQRAQSSQNRIGSAVQRALRESQRSPLSAIRRLLASSPLTAERTAMALQYDQSDEPSGVVPLRS